MASGFWGRPSTPSGWSDRQAQQRLSELGKVFTTQLEAQQRWSGQQPPHNTNYDNYDNEGIHRQVSTWSKGWDQLTNLRPGTAPIPRINHKMPLHTLHSTKSVAITAAQTFLPPAGLSTSATQLRSQYSRRGKSRGESRGESRGSSRGQSRGSVTPGPETTLPLSHGTRRAKSHRESRSRNRSRGNITSLKVRGKKLKRRKKPRQSRANPESVQRQYRKKKRPSTGPAGSSTSSLSAQLPDVRNSSSRQRRRRTKRKKKSPKKDLREDHFPQPPSVYEPRSSFLSGEENEKDTSRIYPDSEEFVRSHRGSSPPKHLLTHSYTRGRDGEYTSFSKDHQAGTFNPNVNFSQWRADDDSIRVLAQDAFSCGGERLEKLNLSGCHNITDMGLLIILSKAVKKVSMQTSVAMKLCELDLSGIGGHLTDFVLITVSQTCKLLKSLNVSGCCGFSDTGFGAIAGWQSSEAQNIWSSIKGFVEEVNDNELTQGWDWASSKSDIYEKLNKITSTQNINTLNERNGTWYGGLGHLRKFIAVGCRLLSDKTIVHFSRGCPMLEVLDVSQCPCISDDGLRPVIDSCKKLLELKCRDNKDGICGDMFRVTAHSHVDCSLFVYCGLRSIDMSGCANLDDNHLTWLAQSCLKLENIDISNCPHVSTRGLTQLVKKCPNLVAITALNVGTIRDGLGRAISENLPRIVSLDLAGASHLTAASLAGLIQKCRDLKHINLSGIPGLSDSVFTGEADVDKSMEVLREDPRYANTARTPVRSLYVGGPAPLLTDTGFAGIAWLFRFACVLDVSGCINFGNTAVYHVSEHCKALTDLNLNRCDSVTDIGVKRITSRCRKLEVLRLSATYGNPKGQTAVGDSSLAAILRRLRLLRILEFRNRVHVDGHLIPRRETQKTQFLAVGLREIDFAGCCNMRREHLLNILSCTPNLLKLNVAMCKFVVGTSRVISDSFASPKYKIPPKNVLKNLLNILPLSRILEVAEERNSEQASLQTLEDNNVADDYTDGVNFHGIRGIENAALLLRQQNFFERQTLERHMAKKLQQRWREWLSGNFTFKYLVIWTNKLRRKAKTIESAITMQKTWRRKIGQRLAWERRREVSAVRIQKCLRSYLKYKNNLYSHLRHKARLRLQSWWRHQLYLKISLRDRIWACVQEQKRIEEDARRLSEGQFFAARAMQNWIRRVWAHRELAHRQQERRQAIWGSALIVPSRPWRRSKVHALPFARFIERRVITVAGSDIAEAYIPERNAEEAAQKQRNEEHKQGKRQSSLSTAKVETRTRASDDTNLPLLDNEEENTSDPSLDSNMMLAPQFSPRVNGNIRPQDVKLVRRYPGRYCGRCQDRHAVVYCTVCLFELCPRCNLELHAKGEKYDYHPPVSAILPRLPLDARMKKQMERANSTIIDVDWNLRHITHVRAQRLAMHEELLVEIERREEIRKQLKEEAQKKEQQRIAQAFTKFAAHWRGLVDRKKFTLLVAADINRKIENKEKIIHDQWARVQSLVRGVQLRAWHIKLRMDDKYLFWTAVNRRKLSYLPGQTKRAWEKAQNILSEEFREHITGKRCSFAFRFGSKVRRYNSAIKLAGTKITNLGSEASDFLKRWHELEQIQKSSGRPMTPILKRRALEFESNGRQLEARSEGWGRIQILMKNRLAFLKDREIYEDRRDAVLLAQDKAFKLARKKIEGILQETHSALQAIEERIDEPKPNFEKMNEKAEDLFEKVRLAEEEEEKRKAEREAEFRKANGLDEEKDEEAEEKKPEEMTEEELLAYEAKRILEEKAAKEKEERLLKEKNARCKKRLRTWEGQWSKRNAWLRREHARAIRNVLAGEKTVLAMANELIMDRTEELRIHHLFDKVQTSLISSIQAEIHYEAEVMHLDADRRGLEVSKGSGAKGILESVRNQVKIREKQHALHKKYAAEVLKCVAEADTMTLRRERFIVADWSDSKKAWAVHARPKRFEHTFEFDSWCMQASEWIAQYDQKPWIDFMQSGKEESNVLKKENSRFDTAIDEARRDQKEKEERNAKEKAEREAIEQAEREILQRQEAERKNIKETYGDVLSDLLTDVSPELTAQRERERRMKMKWHERWKEDIYKFVYASKIRRQEELRRIQESIEQRQKASVGYIEAVCAFHITTGAETAKFAEEQSNLRLNNKPHFRKVDKNLGREWGVHLWTMKTIDQTLMITKMRVGSSVEYNKEQYIDPVEARDNGYERTNEVPTQGEGSTQLVIWTKSDPNVALVLHEVEASFTEKEEKFLQEDGFTRLDPDLGTIRMPPDGRLWAKWSARTADKVEKAKDELYYIQKIEGYQKVLKEEPSNAQVKKAIARLEEDLRQWRRNEESKKQNKLRNMVEFLALDERDMHQFGAHFADIDRDGSGEIDLTEFFDYLDIDRTTYTDSLFAFLDESNDGTIDFAEFVHACGTICMWDKTQVLQFMFSIYDTAGNGYIVENQLQALLLDVSGDDPINMPGTDRVMAKFDKDGDGRVTWAEFKQAAARFPMSFIPAYKMLDTWRSKVMGTKFWKRKKLLFMEVRAKMARDRELAAEAGKAAALERKAKLQADREQAAE